MLRLQFYILRRLGSGLLLVVLVVSAILFVGQTVRFMDRMPDVGLGFLAGVLPLFLPVTLALTLPLAFLVALVLTYGRLSDDNEILAARMAGIHPWAVVAPGIFAGAVVSFLCLDLQGNLAPAAVSGQDALRGDIFARFVEIVERGERNSFSNADFRISWAGTVDGELADLRISRGGARSPDVQDIHARRALLQRDAGGGVLVFVLKDFLMVASEEGRKTTVRGESWTYAVEAADLLAFRGSVAKPRALRHGELLFRMHRLPPGAAWRREMEREVMGRISIALAPLCFAVSGIPLAILLGKGSRSAAAILAFGVAVAFFVAWQAGNSLASAGDLPVAPVMLGGNALLLGVGGWLLRTVVRR